MAPFLNCILSSFPCLPGRENVTQKNPMNIFLPIKPNIWGCGTRSLAQSQNVVLHRLTLGAEPDLLTRLHCQWCSTGFTGAREKLWCDPSGIIQTPAEDGVTHSHALVQHQTLSRCQWDTDNNQSLRFYNWHDVESLNYGWMCWW